MSEANGRAAIYLAALSSNLIALAFIGQMSRLGTAFYAFALMLLSPISSGFRDQRPQVVSPRVPPGRHVVEEFPAPCWRCSLRNFRRSPPPRR